MNPKMIPRAMLGTLVLLEILAIATAESPWPWAILYHESLLLRILGWILVVQFGLGAVAWLMLKAMPDKPCPICHKDLKAYIAVFGPPHICPRCRNVFHTNCFKSKRRCPVCFPEGEETSEIPLDFRHDLPLE